MSTRVAVTPAAFNQTGTTVATFPTFSAAGVDAVGSGTAFATSWPGTISGVVIPNQGNGAVWLYWLSDGTAPGVTQVLVGQVAGGGTGAVLAATVEQLTLPATSSGWLGPWSPVTYNQAAPTLVSYSGLVNATALTAAAQFCVVVDFTTTTSLCVRAYQNSTVLP